MEGLDAWSVNDIEGFVQALILDQRRVDSFTRWAG
jgi:hypothetical protein